MKLIWLIILLALTAAIGSWWAPGLSLAAMILAALALSLLWTAHRDETKRITRNAAESQERYMVAANAALRYRMDLHRTREELRRAKTTIAQADASVAEIVRHTASRTRPTEAKRVARALLDTRSLYAPDAAAVYLARAKQDGAK